MQEEAKLSEEEMSRSELSLELNKTEREISKGVERKYEEEEFLQRLRKLKRLYSRIERLEGRNAF